MGGTQRKLSSVILKRGRERSVLHRHPWVFSGAVGKVDGEVAPGDIVDVRAHDGTWLARGVVNPQSDVFVRIMTWEEAQAVDETLVRERIAFVVSHVAQRSGVPFVVSHVAQRSGVHLHGTPLCCVPDYEQTQSGVQTALHCVPCLTTNSCRLIYLESDGLPGLIADRYADVVVLQILTPAMERWRETVVNALVEYVQPRSIYERSDTDVRQREGLPLRTGLLWGEEPPELIQLNEADGIFLVDIRRGQKTGFFLDQRLNRWCVATHCAGKTVLNCFSYTGAFAIAALKCGADKVINVDTSTDALTLAQKTAEFNGVADRMENVEADVFKFLRKCRDAGRQFDVVILDPPKFAFTKASLDRACRGYKDINWLAIRLLKPGGILVTFSCSGLVTPTLFQSIVAGAAADAKRNVRIIEKLSQPPDHPVLLTFPESEYLKGLVCQVE